ncbi:molybdopterin-dependent oxidoreductase [Hydrogenimonas cancrithermarum]|uniref:Catalytic subunit of nitrate reductase (Flp) n=1 Tax=Hydrogenimonas cancrithermarum TaxID=2993563 RepID=A0ABN6WSU8_9BACT|nr:molybdopterin-dependent oxidoreductase [Hydrogenimonas cancrithermarum]BDY12156.1 catalytic subunit of nitrate reductase (flp) [Hydrogenimonas cancrithermarum]
MKITACPLDCYDACAVVVDPESLKMTGLPQHPFTRGALCPHLNRHIKEARRITAPRIDGKEVSMEEALEAVAEAIREAGEDFLLYRGSGNVGFMQSVTEHFTAAYGGWTTEGSLCDGAGQAGIEAGRGVSLALPPESIEQADAIIVWGRNVSVTDPHMMELLKNKTLIVIDPVKTKVAKMADLYLQIRPRSDFYLAVLLSRFMFMEDMEDKRFMEERCEDAEWYYDFLRTFRVRVSLEKCDIALDDLGDLLYQMQNKKCVFLVGTGVQKYSIGDQVLHAIDGLAAVLGFFGKPGCGVSFLSDSMAGFESPFDVSPKKVAKPIVPFGRFKTVLVQGANPMAQMPGLKKVEEEMARVENLIYFGLYENETSSRARIVLPAKDFLEKEDLRLSYAHPYVQPMPKIKAAEYGISEYELTKFLFESFGFEGLKEERFYIRSMLDQCIEEGDLLKSPAYDKHPYEEEFDTDSGNFEFLEEFEDDFDDEEDGLWLLTPKSPHSLNSQFRRESHVWLHPSHGFKEDEKVRILSEHGEVELPVRVSEDIRSDSVLIYAGTPGVNYLTPPTKSLMGKSACYQEVKITLERV